MNITALKRSFWKCSDQFSRKINKWRNSLENTHVKSKEAASRLFQINGGGGTKAAIFAQFSYSQVQILQTEMALDCLCITLSNLYQHKSNWSLLLPDRISTYCPSFYERKEKCQPLIKNIFYRLWISLLLTGFKLVILGHCIDAKSLLQDLTGLLHRIVTWVSNGCFFLCYIGVRGDPGISGRAYQGCCRCLKIVHKGRLIFSSLVTLHIQIRANWKVLAAWEVAPGEICRLHYHTR